VLELADWRRKIHVYARLTRLDQPIGSLLLLWPTLWALWTASAGWPGVELMLIFCLGTVLMRSAGCAINDYADRDFDGRVERTARRPLPAGEIHPREALAVAGVLAGMAFLLVLRLNVLSVVLSFVALFLAASYPLTKRFFVLPQAYLGIAFGFGIPMAYAAVTDSVPAAAWILLAANVFWAIAYDTEYAMVDRDDDRKIGIHTAAILFGRFDVAAVMVCYAATLGLLGAVGAELGYGLWYFTGLAGAAVAVAYHWWLIRDRSRNGCFAAFRHNNWVGVAIFAGIVLQHS
jgi:4-hydroxybenzoate polyprenyltransferase